MEAHHQIEASGTPSDFVAAVQLKMPRNLTIRHAEVWGDKSRAKRRKYGSSGWIRTRASRAKRGTRSLERAWGAKLVSFLRDR